MKLIKMLFAVSKTTLRGDVALLLLRVVSGVAFMFHGWGKIQHPFSWMGENAFAPGPVQALAALSEFGGGAAWALGFLTPLFSFGILCTMVVATYTVAFKYGAPFVASKSGEVSYELSSVYFCVALVLLAMGPGRLSADRALFGRRGADKAVGE